jgi:hypothetical protein
LKLEGETEKAEIDIKPSMTVRVQLLHGLEG